MSFDNTIKFFNKVKEKLKNKKTYYMLLYIFISLIILILRTQPTFGFDLLNQKMFKGIKGIGNLIQTIGLGYNELYFYLGFILIYTILLFYLMYNKIEECIDNYRKLNPKYVNYTTKDFFINFATDVLYDAFIKTIKILIIPFLIFLILTIGYLIVNNFTKVAVMFKFIPLIIHTTKIILFPIINCWLFFIYYIFIDLSC
jgi:hypothetical protein